MRTDKSKTTELNHEIRKQKNLSNILSLKIQFVYFSCYFTEKRLWDRIDKKKQPSRCFGFSN